MLTELSLFKAGLKQKIIAEEIGVRPSTISRELRRNMPALGRKAGIYEEERAQQKAEKRHQIKPKLLKFDDRMKEYAAEKLQEKNGVLSCSAKGNRIGKVACEP